MIHQVGNKEYGVKRLCVTITYVFVTKRRCRNYNTGDF